MSEGKNKRKGEFSSNDRTDKRQKQKKQWRVPKKSEAEQRSKQYTIDPGDSGIWITCNMNKEPACVNEAKDLFNSYAESLYGDNSGPDDGEKPTSGDLESAVTSELSDLQKPSDFALFQNIKIDTRCVLFLKTQKPVEPVSFVQRICQDASQGSVKKQTRFIKRLTPMTMMGKATEAGLELVAKAVLAPSFHSEDIPPKRFAIRTTTRDNNLLKRDDIIKRVASLVGTKHSVDLKNYDLLILVEVYRNVLGMSVVGSNYERLKRYNLSEIYAPTSKAE